MFILSKLFKYFIECVIYAGKSIRKMSFSPVITFLRDFIPIS